ncbi:MAG: cytochrome c3 family protein, partial [Bilophila sp.]
MKRALLCLCGILVFSFPVWAEDPAVTPEMKALIEKPILMEKTGDAKKHVTFNHATHKDQKCAFCHHKATQDQKTYVSCASEGCHNIL